MSHKGKINVESKHSSTMFLLFDLDKKYVPLAKTQNIYNTIHLYTSMKQQYTI